MRPMRSRSRTLAVPTIPVILALLLSVLAASDASFAQSDADLRRENERLTQRTADLESELAAARARIADLEAQIAALRTGTTPTIPPTQPVDEAELAKTPLASPRALLAAVRVDYEKEIAPEARLIDQLESDDPGARREARKAFDRWFEMVARRHRGNVAWRIRVLSVDPLGDDESAVRAELVSESGESRSRPFVVRASDRDVRYLETWAARPDFLGVLLRARVEPRLAFDIDRIESGPFDTPPFVGRYVNFGFSIDLPRLTPILRERETDRTSGG